MKTLKNLWANKSSKGVKAALAALTLGGLGAGASALTLMNATVESKINSLFSMLTHALKALYKGLRGIILIVGSVVIVYCLVLRMVSKNPRSVDEATQWIKRVLITMVVFFVLGWVIDIIGSVGTTVGSNTAQPWS